MVFFISEEEFKNAANSNIFNNFTTQIVKKKICQDTINGQPLSEKKEH